VASAPKALGIPIPRPTPNAIISLLLIPPDALLPFSLDDVGELFEAELEEELVGEEDVVLVGFEASIVAVALEGIQYDGEQL
jgi:hypothetical protein